MQWISAPQCVSPLCANAGRPCAHCVAVLSKKLLTMDECIVIKVVTIM